MLLYYLVVDKSDWYIKEHVPNDVYSSFFTLSIFPKIYRNVIKHEIKTRKATPEVASNFIVFNLRSD